MKYKKPSKLNFQTRDMYYSYVKAILREFLTIKGSSGEDRYVAFDKQFQRLITNQDFLLEIAILSTRR